MWAVGAQQAQRDSSRLARSHTHPRPGRQGLQQPPENVHLGQVSAGHWKTGPRMQPCPHALVCGGAFPPESGEPTTPALAPQDTCHSLLLIKLRVSALLPVHTHDHPDSSVPALALPHCPPQCPPGSPTASVFLQKCCSVRWEEVGGAVMTCCVTWDKPLHLSGSPGGCKQSWEAPCTCVPKSSALSGGHSDTQVAQGGHDPRLERQLLSPGMTLNAPWALTPTFFF